MSRSVSRYAGMLYTQGEKGSRKAKLNTAEAQDTEYDQEGKFQARSARFSLYHFSILICT